MEENPDDENSPTECEKPSDMDLFMQSIDKEIEKKGIKCDTCDIMFFKRQNLKKHKESIHSTMSPRLQIPVKSKDHEKPPIIKQEDNECEKPFDMNQFMQDIDKEIEKKGIKCDTCDVSFFKKQDLMKHKE